MVHIYYLKQLQQQEDFLFSLNEIKAAQIPPE